MKKVARFLQVNKQVEERVRTSVLHIFLVFGGHWPPFFYAFCTGIWA